MLPHPVRALTLLVSVSLLPTMQPLCLLVSSVALCSVWLYNIADQHVLPVSCACTKMCEYARSVPDSVCTDECTHFVPHVSSSNRAVPVSRAADVGSVLHFFVKHEMIESLLAEQLCKSARILINHHAPAWWQLAPPPLPASQNKRK